MASKIKVKLIIELRAAQMSQREISRTRKMSQHSVGDIYKIADQLDVTYNVIWKKCTSQRVWRQHLSIWVQDQLHPASGNVSTSMKSLESSERIEYS